MLLIQKSTAKLCRYRFRIRQRKIVSLPIQKSTTKNYVAADLEIRSDGGVIFGFNLLFLCLQIKCIIKLIRRFKNLIKSLHLINSFNLTDINS
jgi:hypothetical protein